MNEIKEIKLPKGVESISVTQHDDKIVINLIREKRKFKAGDKVRIKDGISSKTHPSLVSIMDKFIGKELTVKGYSDGCVSFNGDNYNYYYDENWFEPYTDEPKNGDLAIFWDNDDSKEYSSIRLYDRKGDNVHYGSCHYDSCGISWRNAIKFESKEQYEKILKGEE